MDKRNKQQCASQLKQISELLSADTADAPELMILETCASLIGIVGISTPASSLNSEQFQEHMFAYQLIYQKLKPFMTDAAKRIPLDESQNSLMITQTLYDEQRKKYEEYLSQQKKLLDDLKQCREATEAIYNTHDSLFREYEEASAKLTELRRLEQEYDPVRLPELTSQVDALTTETEYLRERYEILNTQTAECLRELENILKNMSSPVSEYTQKIEQVRSEAEDLAHSIETAVEVSSKYKNWFETSQTPLQHLESLLGKNEMTQLRGTLNEDTLCRKNELVRRIRSDLEQLDQIVSICAGAAQSDYENISRKAGK